MKAPRTRKSALIPLGILLIGALLIGQGALPSVVAAASPTVKAADETGDSSQTITVVGKGVVTAKPDAAEVTVGVEAVDSQLDKASDDSSTTLDDIVQALMDTGIAEEDIRRSDFSIWCETDWSSDEDDDEDNGDDGTRYHVTNSVLVTVHDLDQVTDVIRTAVGEGANTMYGVNYKLEDMSALEAEAREDAVADARAKAKQLADLTDLTVGKVLSVSEVIGESEAYSGYNMTSPGAIELSVSLQVTYAAE